MWEVDVSTAAPAVTVLVLDVVEVVEVVEEDIWFAQWVKVLLALTACSLFAFSFV